LGAALNFISTHRKAGIVYVHCKIGYSRSAAVVGSWLMETGIAATWDDAVARIRTARPSVVVRPEALAALRAFSRTDRAADTLVARLIEVQT
jgi:protein phosphatase